MADPAAAGPDPGPDPGPGRGDDATAERGHIKFSTPAQPTDSGTTFSASRPSLHIRQLTESSLPAHLRESITNVPVTPGIAIRTYSPESRDSRENTGTNSPNYFQAHPPADVATSPDPLDDNMAASTPGDADAASVSGHDILRRMSKSSRTRRESISDIRATYPALHLSGNVISATFNMPHSLKYRKGADWVRVRRHGFQTALCSQSAA